MKYLVRTNCLQQHDVGVIVEAESKAEVIYLTENLEGDIYYDNYDAIEQIDIETIEIYEG